MESVVPSQIIAELTQILSNLVLGDNEIRATLVFSFFLGSLTGAKINKRFDSAEKVVNERLAHTPEPYLLALAQFAITADTEVVGISLLVIADILMGVGRCGPFRLFFFVVCFLEQ